MGEDGYVFLGILVGAIALFIVLARFACRSKPAEAMKRRPSVLADRMDEIQRRRPQDEGARVARPTRRGILGEARLLSKNSFRLSRSRDASPTAREDSPLLSAAPLSPFGEEKKEIRSWDPNTTGGSGRSGAEDDDSETGSRKTALSAALTTLTAADDALLGTFMEVMSEGLPIKIHRSSGRARKTTLWLKEKDTLVWFSKRTLGAKRWHKLSLRGVTTVGAGKDTHSQNSPSGGPTDESTCLWLQFPSLSLGLEASSELERDALVQGFSMLIEDLKAVDEFQAYRDPETGTREI